MHIEMLVQEKPDWTGDSCILMEDLLMDDLLMEKNRIEQGFLGFDDGIWWIFR